MSRPPAERRAERMRAVARAARDWRDPEHDARAEAVQDTLDAPNRFTEEALAFAVNAATHRLTEEALRDWWGERPAPREQRAVAVAPGEAGAPLAGLTAALAAVLAGHRVVFCPPEASPALVPAFAGAVQQQAASDFFEKAESAQAALNRADAAIGAGEEQDAFRHRCKEAEIPAARRLWREAAFSVAVLDGNEDDDAREGLAEDALLYEGHGRSSVRLVWAPAGTAPDPYLDAMARFRAVFPAHEDTPGALQMQKAFLEARGQSHAHGDGLEFLVSRGAPEVQTPGHLRWAEYDDLGEVRAWMADRGGGSDASVHAVAARVALHERLGEQFERDVFPFGQVHRQWLEAPGAEALLDFAAGL